MINIYYSKHQFSQDREHGRPQRPLLFPGVFPNSCPLRWWCYPDISFSVIPFFSCLQSFPASRSFPMSWLFTLHRWPKYWSLSFSISPSNEYSELISFRINWFDLLQSKGISGVFSLKELKASILRCSAFFKVQLPHPYMTWKNHGFDYTDLCWQSDVPTF